MDRTNIVIDDGLIRKAMKPFGVKTRREAVEIALRKIVDRAEFAREARALRGKLHWEGDRVSSGRRG